MRQPSLLWLVTSSKKKTTILTSSTTALSLSSAVSRTEDQKAVISSYMQEIEARHPLEKCTYNGHPGYMYVIYSTSEEVKDYTDWMEKVFYIGISLEDQEHIRFLTHGTERAV